MKTPPTKPIRVMLVDDHTMVRRGLATFLKVFNDLQLVGEAEGARLDLTEREREVLSLMIEGLNDSA